MVVVMTSNEYLAQLTDSRGLKHTITQRNLRAYRGRKMFCQKCDLKIEINEAPLICEDCGEIPDQLISEAHHWWNQPQLENSRVLMIGCGAIGNEIAKNLILMGVKKISIVDFDKIETHNLSRTVLFNKFTMDNTESLYKVDVMKTALKALNPDVDIQVFRTGVLDPISRRSSRFVRWKEPPLDEEKLVKMSIDHDLCVVATDGVAPKSFLAHVLYPLIPMVQAAMNNNGSVVMVKVSLPMVTGCIMCPEKGEPIQLDEEGAPWPYYQNMRKKTGAGGCQNFADAEGAASFTDANAVAGSLATSQCINVLMGWPQYRDSEFTQWPMGVPVPLWDEIHYGYTREPGNCKNRPLKKGVDKYGEFICVECSTLAANARRWGSILEEFGEEPMFEDPLISPRYLAEYHHEDDEDGWNRKNGVRKPGTTRCKLGD